MPKLPTLGIKKTGPVQPHTPLPARPRAIDPWSVLIYPHLAEKSTALVESQNTLVFMARRSASKAQIRESVERAFAVKVQKVTTLITQTGHKKAYIRLDPKFKAIDITTRLGMV